MNSTNLSGGWTEGQRFYYRMILRHLGLAEDAVQALGVAYLAVALALFAAADVLQGWWRATLGLLGLSLILGGGLFLFSVANVYVRHRFAMFVERYDRTKEQRLLAEELDRAARMVVIGTMVALVGLGASSFVLGLASASYSIGIRLMFIVLGVAAMTLSWLPARRAESRIARAQQLDEDDLSEILHERQAVVRLGKPGLNDDPSPSPSMRIPLLSSLLGRVQVLNERVKEMEGEFRAQKRTLIAEAMQEREEGRVRNNLQEVFDLHKRLVSLVYYSDYPRLARDDLRAIELAVAQAIRSRDWQLLPVALVNLVTSVAYYSVHARDLERRLSDGTALRQFEDYSNPPGSYVLDLIHRIRGDKASLEGGLREIESRLNEWLSA